MNAIGRLEWIVMALLLSLGCASAGYFVSKTLYNANVGVNIAEVKGLAERRVQADRAYWKVQFSVNGSDKAQVAQLYEQLEQNQATIIQLLRESGFAQNELKPGIINYQTREFRDETQKLVEVNYILTGSLDMETDNVHMVAEVRSKLNKLIAQGIDIQNYAPAYHFTQLNAIKPEMLKEATTNARLAANEFATNAGVRVGAIKNAHQGGFIIRDVGEDYGDTGKVEKDVRVVTTITFYLTE